MKQNIKFIYKLFQKVLLVAGIFLACAVVKAQEFTNKGKNFWLCFPSHTPLRDVDRIFLSKMSLFITSDKNSSGKILIPGTFNSSFTVTAGQVTEIDVPYSLAHINFNEAGKVVSKGIHVQTDAGKPGVVVYAHIYAGRRSAASLVLPVLALGKKYYSMNAFQRGMDNSKSQFVVVAVYPNTAVRITPVKEGIAEASFTVMLPNAGDVYELQDGKDLSGSLIESIPSGTEACKKIAVFSGSSAVNIAPAMSCLINDSFEPLYQQLYPVNVWGKNYGFVPFANYSLGNPYRILAAEDNTTVTMNGIVVATLNAGQYYPNNTPPIKLQIPATFITADKPISVAQYAQSAFCSGVVMPDDKGYGDGDMVMLNPVEQNINDITVFSSNKEEIFPDGKFINVMLKSNAATSFTVNGVAPVTTWQPMLPVGTDYVYAKINLPANLSAFNLKADSAFNAVAYGFGNYESYAYSAGTNVKDLFRTFTVENEFGKAPNAVSCANSSFKISFTFPYIPVKINVSFFGALPDETINNPIPVETFLVNGKTVYRFRLAGDYKLNNTGSFPITIAAENTSLAGCNNGVDEVDYELNIVNKPKADYTFVNTGCITDQVTFTDASNANGTDIVNWYWNLGNGKNSTQKDTVYNYSTAKDYTVTHWMVNNIGCGSDTAKKLISITEVPVAAFSISDKLLCEKSTINFLNESTVGAGGSIVSSIWTFGDNTEPQVATTPTIAHYYSAAGSFTASVKAITNSGCTSQPKTAIVNVNAKPLANFQIPGFCLPKGTGTFINSSTISNGTAAQLKYNWQFTDDNSISTDTDPVHTYSTEGPHPVTLQVMAISGCTHDTSMQVNTIVPQTKLAANAIAENCVGSASIINVNVLPAGNKAISNVYWRAGIIDPFTNITTAPGASNLPISTVLTTGNHTIQIYGEVAGTGCNTDTITKAIHVNKLPTANFTAAQPYCNGQEIKFIDASTANEGQLKKWNWTFASENISTEQNPIKILATGIYNVQLTTETDKGCKAIGQPVQITVGNIPVADFSMPEICLNDPFAQFINKSTIADGAIAQLTYNWNFDDANAGAANTSTDKDPIHKYAYTNTFQVQLKATSKNGCVANVTKPFVVNGIKPVANFSIENANAICSNTPLVIKNISTVDFGSITKTEIFWDVNSPALPVIDENPVPEKIYQYKYPVTSNADKTYTLKYVAYSGIACTSEKTATILLKANPEVQFNPLQPICENADPITISTAKEITGVVGKGAFSGSGITTQGLFTPRLAKPGEHTLQYTFTANNGCKNVANTNIIVMPAPRISAGPDKVVVEGDKVILNATASPTGLSYQWQPSDFMDNATVLNPTVAPLKEILYTLTATSPQGCAAADAVNVKVINGIAIPNAFTPNKDGKNDVWNIRDINAYPSCIVQVFNRWGQRVFYSQGYITPWDGTNNGNLLDTGTYIFTIDLKKGKKQVTGTVMLIK